jgi:hypothetical protein
MSKSAPKTTGPAPRVYQNMSKRLHIIGGQRLSPGQTSEPYKPEVAARIAASPAVRAGELVGLRDDQVPAPVPRGRPADLSKAKEADAIELVKSEKDLATLMAWSENDQRPAVQAAIQKQVESL